MIQTPTRKRKFSIPGLMPESPPLPAETDCVGCGRTVVSDTPALCVICRAAVSEAEALVGLMPTLEPRPTFVALAEAWDNAHGTVDLYVHNERGFEKVGFATDFEVHHDTIDVTTFGDEHPMKIKGAMHATFRGRCV